MQFGLWFEPEAVSKDSGLYTEHPDWILHIPGYEPTEGRHEYLLDLTRCEVRDYIVSVLEHYLGGCGIDYVKWDMNRPLTDILTNAEFRRHDLPDDNYTVWSMTSADKKKCVIMIFQKLYNPLSTHVSFRINCLDEKLDYREETSGKLYGGDELKYCGISIPAVKEDFHTFIYNFKAV